MCNVRSELWAMVLMNSSRICIKLENTILYWKVLYSPRSLWEFYLQEKFHIYFQVFLLFLPLAMMLFKVVNNHNP